MESSQTATLAEYQHSNPEEYGTARLLFAYNHEKGDLKDFYCPVCKNKGRYYSLDETGKVIVKECACKSKRASMEAARNSGMGGTLLAKNFGNFEKTEGWQSGVFEKVKKYSETVSPHNCKWLSILGQSGCGKTHLCCAVSNQLIEDGAKVIYMVWNNAVKELKRNATDDEAYSELFDKYASAEVLYIDDFFKGKVTETDITIAFELINYRYNNPDCITIISSELLLSDIFNIDEAVAGRILERCGENVIQIKPDTGKNYRRKSVANL